MMTSQAVQQKVIHILQSVLQGTGMISKKLPLGRSLYERGFGMDSLDAAAFPARPEGATSHWVSRSTDSVDGSSQFPGHTC